jgi:hypothetical protein
VSSSQFVCDPRPIAGNILLTRHCQEARRVNTDVLAWEDHLMAATSTGVWYVNQTTPLPRAKQVVVAPAVFCALATLDAVSQTNPAKSRAAPRMLVGQFALAAAGGGGNRTMLMIVNQDDGFNVNANMTFRPEALAEAPYVCEVSREHGREVAVVQEGTEHFQVDVSSAGELGGMMGRARAAWEAGVEHERGASAPSASGSAPASGWLQLTIGAGDARLLVLSKEPCGQGRQ